MEQPNAVKVAWGIVAALRRTDPPRPHGHDTFDSTALRNPLDALVEGGLPGLAETRGEIRSYISLAAQTMPDLMNRNEALSFWINLYNAGAMSLAIEAFDSGENSVLRVPGGFGRPLLTVAGERLSLDAIEHGKLRRFKDPRIHGAMVCGSLSCPTLRATPYTGPALEAELDDQMRVFLSGGGAVVEGDTVHLSRVFSWFGRDFVSPSKMPTFLPATRKAVRQSLSPWLSAQATSATRVEYQGYDWGLACKIS